MQNSQLRCLAPLGIAFLFGCQPGPYSPCVTAEECSGGYGCVELGTPDGVCLPLCATDAECDSAVTGSSGYYCALVGACVRECVADVDCPSGASCFLEARVCVGAGS